MAKRTQAGYLNELIDILQKLETDIEHVKSGQLTYFKEIALKLRVLLCDKSRQKSLLKKVCDIFNFNILVLVSFTMEEKVEKGILPSSLMKGLTFEQINSVITWFERGDDKVDIFDAIERKEVLINGIRHSYKKIIEVAADKMAAHVDEIIPDEDLELHNEGFLIGGLPIAQRAIFDSGRTMIFLLKSIIDFLKNKNKYDWIEIRDAA